MAFDHSVRLAIHVVRQEVDRGSAEKPEVAASVIQCKVCDSGMFAIPRSADSDGSCEAATVGRYPDYSSQWSWTEREARSVKGNCRQSAAARRATFAMLNFSRN